MNWIIQQTVHLYTASFRSYSSFDLWNILSEDEKIRANSFAFEYLRHNFVVCRGILRKVLSIFLKCAPQLIHFRYSKYDKPEIFFPKSSLHFNVSHSGEYFVIAVSNFPLIGIDIEYCNKDVELFQIAHEVFTQNEIARLLNTSSGRRRVAEFYTMWTIKEAFMKAIGTGFSFSPKWFEIDGKKRSFHFTNSNKGEFLDLQNSNPLYFMQLDFEPKYALALVTPFPKIFIDIHYQ